MNVCGKIVTGTKLVAFMQANKKIGKRMMDKFEANAKASRERGYAKMRKNVASAAVAHNMKAMDQIESALTMWLDPETERPDIVVAMWLAVAEGRLDPADIKKQAKSFVTAHRRGYTNTGRFAFGSLDAPMGDDNPTSRIELISEDNRLWG